MWHKLSTIKILIKIFFNFFEKNFIHYSINYKQHFRSTIMKKVILSVASLFLATAIHAESCATSVQGFYAGVNAGLQHSAGQYKWDFTGNQQFQKSSIGKNTFVGGLFAGYQKGVGSCMIVGGEAYGNFASYNENVVDDTEVGGILTARGTLSSKFTFGAKIRLGYTMSQRSIFFVGLGAEYTATTLKVERIDHNNPAVPQRGDAIIKKTKKGINFAPSVGVDMFANDKLFVRAEYTYVFPSSLTIEQPINNAAGAANDKTGTHKAKFNNSRFTLGIGYKF